MLWPQKEPGAWHGGDIRHPAKGDPVPVTLVPASELTHGAKYLGAGHSHVSFRELQGRHGHASGN